MTHQLSNLGTRIRRRVPGLLHERSFRRFWTAQTISYMGDQVTMIALPLTAIVTLHASSAQIGILAAMSTLPNLLFSLHAGASVDRYGGRRRLMIFCDLIRAVLLASVPVAFALGVLTLIQLFVVAFVAGVLATLFNVCSYSLYAALVKREDYVQGMALTRGSFSFSWASGPAIGGVLVQVLSAPVVIILDAASFLASALLLRTISPAEPPAEVEGRPEIGPGLRFVRDTPALLAKFAGGSALNLFYSIYFTLILLFAARELHLSPGLIGVALSLGAVGALLGSLITSSTSRRFGLGPTFILGSVLFPCALVLVPLAPGNRLLDFVFLVGAEFLSGIGLMLCDITGSTLQQALTPDRLRSRIQGANLALTNGVRTAGALVAGGLGTWIGLRATLWLAVIGGVVSVLPLVVSPIPRMSQLPDQVSDEMSDQAS